jgi:competence protein ComEC
LRNGRDSFTVREWLAADADARTPKDASLSTGVTCDAVGCIGKLADGRLASMVLEVEAFAEDCPRTAVVVSIRETPSLACAATLIDREVWRAPGAIASRWSGQHFEQSVTLPSGYERPWTRAISGSEQGPREPAPREAALRSETLEADD